MASWLPILASVDFTRVAAFLRRPDTMPGGGDLMAPDHQITAEATAATGRPDPGDA
jgi:hypothetical protein